MRKPKWWLWLLRFLPVVKVTKTVYVFDRNAIKPLNAENINCHNRRFGPVN